MTANIVFDANGFLTSPFGGECINLIPVSHPRSRGKRGFFNARNEHLKNWVRVKKSRLSQTSPTILESQGGEEKIKKWRMNERFNRR